MSLVEDLEALGIEASEEESVGAAAAACGGEASTPGRPLLDATNKKLFTRGVRKRRSAPIVGYIGLNGQGKSLAMVRDTLPSLALGRRVLSTVQLLDPATGEPHPLCDLFRSWEQLHDFHDGDVLLDEVTGVADARDSGMPKHVRRVIPQLRRRNVMLRWTGIDWDNTDRRIRQLTQAVVRCRGFVPNRQLERNSGRIDSLAMWAPNRLFYLTTFDAQRMANTEASAEFTEAVERKKKARVLNREVFWGPSSAAFACYRTLDAVSAVDNSCPICGGRPVERTCRGH